MNSAKDDRTERRLAAILAADVVGYSRLMGVDEEGTHAAVKAIWSEVTDPRIEGHNGRIVKTLGDGLLVEFASVVDAVRCAVAIQREMKRRQQLKPIKDPIVFRIGINVGDVIIDEADIFGDGVNIASRLEGLAEPGGICVSRIVRDQVRDKLGFGFEDLGQRQVKNIARPIHVFKIPLDASVSAPTSQTDNTGFVGKAAPSHSRRRVSMAVCLCGSLAILVAAVLFLKFSGGPAASPAPSASGEAIFFEPGKVALSRWARATLEQQTDYLQDHPDETVTVATYCLDDEGAREGAQVLAQLRANQIRAALEAGGLKPGRIKVENLCRPANPTLSGADNAHQNLRAVLIRN